MIELQKKVGLMMLEHIRKVNDGSAVIGGGAPRDWFMDKPANDIDIYVELKGQDVETFIGKLKLSIEGKKGWLLDRRTGIKLDYIVGAGGYKRNKKTSYDLTDNDYIDHVVDLCLFGQKFQVVIVNKNPVHVIQSEFPMGLSQAYMNNCGGIVRSKLFNKSLVDKTVYFKAREGMTDEYLYKILDRYPTWRVAMHKEDD